MASQPFYLFVLRQAGSPPLLLHPFRAGSPLYAAALAKAGAEGPILEGRFGSLPDAALLEGMRRSLDRDLERGFRAAALDRGFALRVFLSSLAFLAVYLFFSIVVRDPLPLLDEMILGGLAALGAWSFLARRRLASAANQAALAGLRKALGAAYFSESSVAALAEEWLEGARAAARSGPAAFQAWLERREPALDLARAEELGELLALLEAELAKPGLLGPEPVEDLESRAFRQALRRGPLAPGRRAGLAALLLKGRRALAARDAEPSPAERAETR